MNTELVIGVVSAACTSIIGPVVVHYVKGWAENNKKKNDPLAEAISVNSLIIDKLTDMKEKVSSDRIWMIQFHNGGHFYPTGKSIQKFSMVYEVVSSDTTSCQHQFQNIPVSLFSKTINKLYKGDSIKIEDTKSTEYNYGFTTQISEMNVKSAYIYPVTTITDQFVGIIGIDYIHRKKELGIESLADFEIEVATIGGVLANYLNS